MATPGSAAETLRLAQHYRQMTDEELVALAQQKEALTDAAQQALAMEIHSRKLAVPKPEVRTPPRPEPPPDILDDEEDPYARDRQLFEIRTVWSERDARRLQHALDVAGIPFYMGSEKATSVDDVTSDFGEGVPVKVMRVGWPWAYDALWRNYFPQDEKPEAKWEDAGEVATRCPRCKSTDVIFEELVKRESSTSSEPKFRWKCASCGKEWEDDGVQTGG